MDHPDPNDTSGLFVWDADRDVVMGHEFVGVVVGHGPECSDQFPDRHPSHEHPDPRARRRPAW